MCGIQRERETKKKKNNKHLFVNVLAIMNKTVVIHKYALFFDVTLIYKSKYFITGVESYYLKLMEQSISVVYHSDQFGHTEASKRP